LAEKQRQDRAEQQRQEARRRRRRPPPPRALDGVPGSGASEFWLKHKPGYGKAPDFCCKTSISSRSSSSGGVAVVTAKVATTATTAAGASTVAAATTTTTTTTPLADDDRLALLSRAKARHAALEAQYSRLPLCFAADTPSGLRRREALGRALDQARRDAEALAAAANVVVVVAAAEGAATKKR
jgi:hypothetical protein